MFARQLCNGKWVVAKNANHKAKRSRVNQREVWYDTHLVKCNNSSSSGLVNIKTISLPKEFVGKKVRLFIEVVEEKKS